MGEDPISGAKGPSRLGQIKDALDQFESALLRYAYSLVKDRQIAQEIVQETFLEMWQVDSEFVGSGGLRGWLYTVCRNRAFDELRRRKAGVDSREDPDQVPGDVPDPFRVAMAKEARAGLTERLAALPANQREVLRLKLQSGLTYKEIAEVTGLTVSHVGVLLHQAVQKLRQNLQKGAESAGIIEPSTGKKSSDDRGIDS